MACAETISAGRGRETTQNPSSGRRLTHYLLAVVEQWVLLYRSLGAKAARLLRAKTLCVVYNREHGK